MFKYTKITLRSWMRFWAKQLNPIKTIAAALKIDLTVYLVKRKSMHKSVLYSLETGDTCTVLTLNCTVKQQDFCYEKFTAKVSAIHSFKDEIQNTVSGKAGTSIVNSITFSREDDYDIKYSAGNYGTSWFVIK